MAGIGVSTWQGVIFTFTKLYKLIGARIYIKPFAASN